MKSTLRLALWLPCVLVVVLLISVLIKSHSNKVEHHNDERKAHVDRPPAIPDPHATGEKLPIPQSSPPDQSSSQSEAYVRRVLGEILPRYRQAMTRRSPHYTGALRAQEEIHYREARLLALAYPREMEGLLSTLARDQSLNQWERLCCIDLLGELANIGMRTAIANLAELARGPEGGHSNAALRNLACSDRRGEYLELYRTKCRELVRNAFDAVSYYDSAATVNDLELILAKSQDKTSPEARLGLAAKWTLEKINTLRSPTCDQILLGLLDGSEKEQDWFVWAAQVARNRSTPRMTDALRRRLDLTEKALFGSGETNQDRDGFDMKDFAKGATTGIADPYFDEALIAYAESGGALNEAEIQRLYRAGYACDPKKRLEELLATGQ